MLAIVAAGASNCSAMVVRGESGCGAADEGECEEAEATREGDIFSQRRNP
jgi:hypothetical protein